MANKLSAIIQILLIACSIASLALPGSSMGVNNSQASVCSRELENANRTIAKWAQSMEDMVNESELPVSIRKSIHGEANQILDLIEEFGEQIKSKPPAELAKDLVSIRRRSNRMALDIYLNTFDMRWPQTSLQLGVTVERVQQACLDRSAIQALEAPPSVLHLSGAHSN